MSKINKKNNIKPTKPNIFLDIAVSALDKKEYWKDNPEQLEIINAFVNNHPEVASFVQVIEQARTNPEAAKKVAKEFKSASKKTTHRRTEQDDTALMIGMLVLAQENSQYLSDDVTTTIQTAPEFKGFNDGNLGGGGSSGEWTESIQQNFDPTPSYNDSSPTYESPSSLNYD